MQLSDILFRLGIYRIYQCHDYVFTTVTLACQDPELLQALSRRLYPAAAVQCQCTPIAVSRGIRHAVSRAWRLNPSLFSVIAGHPVLTPPTPREFLCMVCNYLWAQETRASAPTTSAL